MNISHYFALLCVIMVLVEVGNGQLPTFFVGFWRHFPPHFYHTTIPSLNGGGGGVPAAIV